MDNKAIIPKYVSVLNYANEVIVLELSISLAPPQPGSRALTFLVVTVYASASSGLFRALVSCASLPSMALHRPGPRPLFQGHFLVILSAPQEPVHTMGVETQ